MGLQQSMFRLFLVIKSCLLWMSSSLEVVFHLIFLKIKLLYKCYKASLADIKLFKVIYFPGGRLPSFENCFKALLDYTFQCYKTS